VASSRLLLAALLVLPAAAAAGELRNWFNDPFFQVRSAVAGCPLPLGPFASEADMKKETHYRAERGTSCYLAKKCAKPNSYLYDPEIAAAVKARFEASPALKDASLWVTVQRRWVYVEGCVPARYADGTLEKLLGKTPDVEHLIVNVGRPGASPPYRTR
jgi:BON domain-containing protein